MRQLKFRAWSSITSKMMLWEDINRLGNLNKLIGLNHVSVQQFTGLKDKNGKEIYEGDIVSTVTDKLMVVTWSNRFASFCIHREGWAFQHWFGEACNPEDCEVMGNIYENAGLLNNSEKPAKAPF
jgi:uncharacterized phage protein (TIGR01671 family)